MKKGKIIILIGLAVLLLVSCDVNFNIKIYLRDIFDVWAGNESVLYTYATMTMPTTSDKDDMNQIINRIKQDFKDVENIREAKISYSDVLLVDFKVPICRVDENYNFPSERFEMVNIALIPSDSANILSIALRFDLDKLNKFNEFVHDLTWSSIDYEDITIECELNNDTRKETIVWTGSCFVNDTPSVYWNKSVNQLKPREEWFFKASDVIMIDGLTTGAMSFIAIEQQ